MSTPEEYHRLAHAMQTGVATDHATDHLNFPRGLPTQLERHLKHERTGINAARVENAALVKLLVDKGVITMDEWWVAAVAGMQAEVDRYEALLTERLGKPVTLA